MPIKTWVPSKDGKQWSSNRTRDVLDLTFVVNKNEPGEPCTVTVRCTYPGMQRAKKVIATLSYDDHKIAKELIEHLVLQAYINFPISDTDDAREWVLNELLTKSHVKYYAGITPVECWVHINNKVITKKLPTVTLTTPDEPEPTNELIDDDIVDDISSTIETMVEHIEEAKSIAESIIEPTPVVPKTITIGGKTIELGWPS